MQTAIDAVQRMLEGPSGIRTQLEQRAAEEPERALSASGFVIRTFGLKRGVTPDEEFSAVPRIRIQVEKLANKRTLKYVPFSGPASMLLLVEASGSRQDEVAMQLHAIVDAILLVLDNHTGALYRGVYFDGSYELQMAQMERGGAGFQQTAQVRFELTIDDEGED
ncbi:MAG: hypothetical protein LC114_21170 [Bryobacterales bacterium]|nr:hypothetical protein [Bryobacterales bacterium]